MIMTKAFTSRNLIELWVERSTKTLTYNMNEILSVFEIVKML